MAAAAPNLNLFEPHRCSIRLPRPLWIGLATVVLIMIAAGLSVGLPIYWQSTAIREIERVGGSIIETRPRGPEWIRERVGSDLRELFEKVIRVDLGDTPATDTTLEHLNWLTSLEDLDLDNTQITDAGLIRLKGLARLKVLWLNGTLVTDTGLSHLTDLISLQSLYLGNTQATTRAWRTWRE